MAAGKSWLSRLRGGLAKSSNRLSDNVGSIFTARKLDAESLGALEDALIAADLGVATAAKLTAGLATTRFDKEAAPDTIRAALATNIAAILAPVATPLRVEPNNRPHVILMVGVNGTGKTTTVGKLARIFADQGKSVMLAAADTFRAAAIEQLELWGARTRVPVFSGATGTDPAAIAYQALEQARADDIDVLLIDTAGRLHNKTELMDELRKICRVIAKLDDSAPHDCLLVLDATTGQNAHAQVETFSNMVDITGLVVTKLDGTAKGGVIVALADRFGLPIHAVGVGESVEDLQPFEADDFAQGLLGI